MKRPTRARRRRAAVVSGGALLFALAACSATSPATVVDPYDAADGVSAPIGTTDVSLHNFLIVGAEEGGPASVVGSIVNRGDASVTVNISADPGSGGTPTSGDFTVPPRGTTQIGPDRDDQLTLTELPAPPGGLVGMSAATASGGTSATIQVPVIPPVNEYATLTPGTASIPTPASTVVPEETPTPEESPTS